MMSSPTSETEGSGGGQVLNVASSGLGPKLISPKIVEELTSLKRRSIDRAVKSGRFPTPVRLSDSRIAFFENEVREWIEARPRISARDSERDNKVASRGVQDEGAHQVGAGNEPAAQQPPQPARMGMTRTSAVSKKGPLRASPKKKGDRRAAR